MQTKSSIMRSGVARALLFSNWRVALSLRATLIVPTTMTIPTISLRSTNLAQEVYEACTTSGFFYLEDHDIDAEKLGAWRASQELFLDETKEAIKQKNDSIDREGHTGYTAL